MSETTAIALTEREQALQGRAWPFEEARKILTRIGNKTPEKGYVLFETGYGPSGLPHIGTFGEVFRTTLVRRVFERLTGAPTELYAFSDDMAGLATRVEVVLQGDGGVRVVDDGRGIPVGMHPVEKRPAVEMVMTMLHAGGKFDSDSYAVFGGLHGVGVSVVNALSTALDVEILTDGHVWRQHYARS